MPLDGLIIEEIRRREKEQKEERDRPQIEIPVDEPTDDDSEPGHPSETPRGVVIIGPGDEPEDIGKNGEIKPTELHF